MKNKIQLVSLCLCLALIGGCSSSPDNVKAPRGPVDDPLPADAYPQIILLGGLHKQLVGSNLIIDKPTDSRPMRVRVTLRSITDEDLPVRYRFVFLGADGASVSDDPSYISLSFAARTQRTLTEVAPTYKAVDWKLEVRPY